MTVIDPQVTLGELVTLHPSLARELERQGLDYCCGGAQTLADACAERGLDPDATTARLAAAATDEAPAPWASMSVPELVDHLVATHHRYLWDEMPRLSELLAKIVSVHGSRHPELADVQRAYEEFRADMEPHLVKEEQVLFPMVLELAAAHAAPRFHCGTLRNPIAVMLREHDLAGSLLEALRDLTNGYRVPDDGCASYRAAYAALARLEDDTHQHVHKENNVLFPAVMHLEARLSEPA